MMRGIFSGGSVVEFHTFGELSRPVGIYSISSFPNPAAWAASLACLAIASLNCRYSLFTVTSSVVSVRVRALARPVCCDFQVRSGIVAPRRNSLHVPSSSVRIMALSEMEKYDLTAHKKKIVPSKKRVSMIKMIWDTLLEKSRAITNKDRRLPMRT